jgi:hypothetical protein
MYKYLVDKPLKKHVLNNLRQRWQNNIKIILKKYVWDYELH